MANQKYTDDSDITTLFGTEKLPIAKSGVDYYCTPNEFKTFVLTSYAGDTTIVSTGVVSSGTWSANFAPRIKKHGSLPNYTFNVNTDDVLVLTSQTSDIYFGNPTGTPADFQELIISITSDSSVHVIGFSASSFRFSSSLPNPAATIASKTIYFIFKYNLSATKWDCITILNNF